MKHFLFAVTMLFGILTVSGQQYDAVDLLGKWNVTSRTGQISKTLDSFKSVIFGDIRIEVKDYKIVCSPIGVLCGVTNIWQPVNGDMIIRNYDYVPLDAAIISEGSKLNIIPEGGSRDCCMALIINRMTDEEIILTNFTRTCELTLTKEGASKVEAISTDEKGTTEYYSVNGTKVEHPDKGIFVEKTGNASHLIVK